VTAAPDSPLVLDLNAGTWLGPPELTQLLELPTVAQLTSRLCCFRDDPAHIRNCCMEWMAPIVDLREGGPLRRSATEAERAIGVMLSTLARFTTAEELPKPLPSLRAQLLEGRAQFMLAELQDEACIRALSPLGQFYCRLYSSRSFLEFWKKDDAATGMALLAETFRSRGAAIELHHEARAECLRSVAPAEYEAAVRSRTVTATAGSAAEMPPRCTGASDAPARATESTW